MATRKDRPDDVPDPRKEDQGRAGAQGGSEAAAREGAGENALEGLRYAYSNYPKLNISRQTNLYLSYLWGNLASPVGEPKKARIDDPLDGDRAPDLIEPVLAWRGWEISMSGHLTGSAAGQGFIFDPGPNRAVCRHEGHTEDVPAVGCECGFYGWHEPRDIQHGQIKGAIKCWGEIIVHDVGIRAEFCQIVCLFEPTANKRSVELAAKRYGVPIVKSQDEAEALAGVEGIRVPEAMRPEKVETVDSYVQHFSWVPNVAQEKLYSELHAPSIWQFVTEEQEVPSSSKKKDSSFGRLGPGHEQKRRR